VNKFLDERNAAYDSLAKRFLARKSILAHILKNVVPEFADSSLQDIERKYIEGDPTSTINTIPLDDTLDIKGKHTESNSPLEGLVTFDIIFDAIAPSTGEPIKLIINIEPQKTTTSIDYKSIIETNVSVDRLAVYKRGFYQSTYAISSWLGEQQGLSRQDSYDMFISIHYHAVGIHGILRWNPIIAAALEKESITPPKLDFRENLKSFIMMNLEHYAKKQQK